MKTASLILNFWQIIFYTPQYAIRTTPSSHLPKPINDSLTAVFTYDDFFVGFDIELTLWWDLCKASTATVSIDGCYCNSITVVIADTVVGNT